MARAVFVIYVFLVALVISAVATDWYCAFEWFSKQFPLFSGPVISRMLAIVLSCAAIGSHNPSTQNQMASRRSHVLFHINHGER